MLTSRNIWDSQEYRAQLLLFFAGGLTHASFGALHAIPEMVCFSPCVVMDNSDGQFGVFHASTAIPLVGQKFMARFRTQERNTHLQLLENHADRWNRASKLTDQKSVVLIGSQIIQNKRKGQQAFQETLPWRARTNDR